MAESDSGKPAKVEPGTFACRVCGRRHVKPREGDPAVICPCGWWYEFVDGRVAGHFHDPF